MSDKYKYQDAYEQRKGIIAKTYKLKRETVDRFAEACKQNKVSQARQLEKMMDEYCKEGDKGNE